jgi:integrase
MCLNDEVQGKISLSDKVLTCNKRSNRHLLNKYNKHLEPHFGKKNLETLKRDSLIKYIQYLKGQNRAPNTINGVMQQMSAMINYSIKFKELKLINPCVGIVKISEDNQRQRYLTKSDIFQLYAKLQDDPRSYLFVKLALSTGCRLKGILNIKKIDLNLDRNSITLKDFKNNDTYNGFMDDELKSLLEEQSRGLNPMDYILSARDTPLSTNALSSKLRPVLNELFNEGLKTKDSKNRVVIHTLRHTFASHLAINGTPIFTIQKLMNHRDIKMTMRYAKLAPDSGMEMVKVLYQ